MFTPEDLRNLTFNKGMNGYRSEEVDSFLEEMSKELTANVKDKEELEEKLFILAEKIEEYRAEEELVKTALINAQRLGENVIHEAKVKADVILRDANAQAERITEAAETSINKERLVLSRLKSEVSNFKNEVLNLYKEHINLLSTLSEENLEIEEFKKPEVDIDNILSDATTIAASTKVAEPSDDDLFDFLDAEPETTTSEDEDNFDL